MALPAGPKTGGKGGLPEGLGPVDFIRTVSSPPYSWQDPILAELGADRLQVQKRTADGGWRQVWTPRPRIAYVQVARKNGKSRLAADVAINEMCNKRGRQTFLIADSERNLKSALFFELCSLVRSSQVLSAAVLLYKDHLECPSTGGAIWLRPNNLSASQSINPDLVIFDEVHMQRDDRIWNGMALAGAAMPHALLLGITTPGYDITGMAHGLYESVRAGATWGRIFEPADPNCTLTDEQAIIQANPVLVDRPDMLDIFRMELDALPEHDYRRFRLGQWTTTASAWFPYGKWQARRGVSEVTADTPVWLGFDGSYSGDSTALVACTREGFLSVLGCWENPGTKGWRVPREEVDDTVREAFETLNVQMMYVDPPYWGREIAEWDVLWPGRIMEFPTFSRARMAPACTGFYAAVMDGSLTHDGDARLTRHVANCVVKPSPQGDYITKADKDSPAKIDLAVAAVLAHQGAVTAPARGPVFVL